MRGKDLRRFVLGVFRLVDLGQFESDENVRRCGLSNDLLIGATRIWFTPSIAALCPWRGRSTGGRSMV